MLDEAEVLMMVVRRDRAIVRRGSGVLLCKRMAKAV